MLKAMRASCKEAEATGCWPTKRKEGFCPTSSVLGISAARDVEICCVSSFSYINVVCFVSADFCERAFMDVTSRSYEAWYKGFSSFLLKSKASSRYLK